MDWIQQYGIQIAIIFGAGLTVGLIGKFFLDTLGLLLTLSETLARTKRHQDMVKHIYDEVYPQARDMSKKIEELAGYLWKLDEYRQYGAKLDAIKQEMNILRRDINVLEGKL